MSALPQVGRPKLGEQVARLLEERILSGEWRPGDAIPPEQQLAVQLGVSRSVVADAADAVDWERGSAAHLDFHLGILDAVRSPVLRVLLRPMQEIIFVTGYGPVEEDPERWNVKAHRDILDAIRARDEPAARAAMA